MPLFSPPIHKPYPPIPREPENVKELMELRIQQVRKKEKELREEYKVEKVRIKKAFMVRGKERS